MMLYSLPLGTIERCKACGAAIELREMLDYKARPFRYWSDCPCIGQAADRAAQLAADSTRLQAAQRVEVVSDPIDISRFTFETFDPELLTNGVQLVNIAAGWLEKVSPFHVAPSYDEKPVACLYFHSPGKGRGKTHLAAAIVNEVRAHRRSAVLIDELDYIERYWAATMEAKAQMSDLPAKAWLTVFDDMGQRESTGPGLRDAWQDLVNPRWGRRGWSVITSNWTPDQLAENGTISGATYSRIVEMTHGKIYTFDGPDHRMRGAA
mgnify:FL=1